MARERTTWLIRGRTLSFPPALGVGIVNVNEESFFPGARSGTPERAVEDGIVLVDAGFDLIDVGAVPARSGPPVPAEEEAAALIPAVEGLAAATEAPITADTFSVEVARRAVEAGAAAVNDISGARDPALYDLAADTGCGLVLMHIEGPPREDRPVPGYDDPIAVLRAWFAERIEEATARGVDTEQLALDPGFDFDLGVEDGVEVLRRLDELHELGRPLFVALSRKDFLGAVVAGSWEERAPVEEREWATASAAALAVSNGADLLRLHDRSALQALRVAEGIAA
jgi:dihydropteroate synthase